MAGLAGADRVPAHAEIFPEWLTAGGSVVLVGLIGFAWWSARGRASPSAAAGTEAGGTTTVLRVPDMTCAHCEGTVRSVLEGLDGVTGIRMNARDGRVEITHDASVRPENLADRVTAAGYGAEVETGPKEE